MNASELARHARRLDQEDTLAGFREQFFMPLDENGDELVYLCGNSLGLQPCTVPQMIEQELIDWQTLGVEGHFHARRPWMPYHENLSRPMAELIGALPEEVICMNSLTVNLHLMMVSFYQPDHVRNKILIERGAFPSDRYAVESQILHHGFDPDSTLLELEPRAGEIYLQLEDIISSIEEFGHEIALILLPGTQYYSGQVFDIKRITEAAQKAGCAIGWDLAHSVGNVPLQMHDSNADFAVWCNYKYVNAGPGAIGGCFVHERHCKNIDLIRFSGWWGHDKSTRFEMGPEFRAMPTAEGWQLSNPPILAMTPLISSLQIFSAAGIQELHQKSLAMTRLLIEHLQNDFADDVTIMTPTDDDSRGGQLSLKLKHDGREVLSALGNAGVVCDWREPDCIRIAVAPLYNRYQDISDFASVLATTLQHEK